MEIGQIVGLALVTTVMILIIRQQKPVMAVVVSVVFSVIVLTMMIDKLDMVIQVMGDLNQKAEVNYFFFTTLLKILGIAYLGEFVVVICQDAGEQAVAKKVEFAVKIIIAVLALPIMVAILESLMQLLPG
ncbi:MAG: stage III sporulation protein AD [Syntrophomonadaceae bacterium]|nr:stage III sporulation protein AD [Syntrophomonadaceae bacterium]